MSPERRPEDNGPDPYSEHGKKDRPSLETITRLAREVALRDGGHLPTIIALGSTGGMVSQLPEMPDTHEGRVGLMHLVGAVFGESGQVGRLREVYFICEGWMSQPGAEGTIEMPPSQDPRRVEVLFVSRLAVKQHRSDMIILEMTRDDEGKLTELEETHSSVGEDVQVESPLLRAFVEGFKSGRPKGN